MDRDLFARRLIRFRTLLSEEKCDAFLVSVPENRYYLSGYEPEDMQLTESSGYLLISDTRQYLLTDFRYQEDAKQQAPDFDLVIYAEGLLQTLPDLLSDLSVENLGVEAHFLTHKLFKDVENALQSVRPDSAVRATEGWIENMRTVKDDVEIRLIKESLVLTEKVLGDIWEEIREGRGEKEVAWKIEALIREGGAQSVSFPPIVASGPNSALPHAVPTDRTIMPDDVVVIDLGSKLNRYCSDMTRTCIVGNPGQKIKEIYKVVREAQLAAQDAIHAGMESVEADGIARRVIERAGYGEGFGHGLGHGVGLAVHEEPRLRKKNPTMLRENMVVTIEPGIYLPGLGGVRLENMVRITRDGCEVLSRCGLFYDDLN